MNPSLSENKLIIAFDAKRLFLNNTGLGNYSRTLVKNLQKFYPHHEYHLFTPKIVENEDTKYFFDASKFTIHTPKSSRFLYRTWLMSKAINKLKPHIFHGLSHEIPLGLDSSIQVFVTFHDLIYEKFPQQFGFWERHAYKIKYKSSAFRADHIIAISESTQKDLLAIYNLHPSKINVVYQSCHSDFQTVKNKDIHNLPSPLQQLKGYYLYVGSIIERKGLLDCIKAYNTLPNNLKIPFVVVGSGRGDYARAVLDEIQNLQLEDNFIFLNSISNKSLVSIYDHCSIFLYPSIYEGFGIPIIESLFRQKPVITTQVSSLPEAMGQGGVLVPPNDINAIKNAIIFLMQDTQNYQTLAEAGFQHVKDHFSDSVTAQNLHQKYLYRLQ